MAINVSSDAGLAGLGKASSSYTVIPAFLILCITSQVAMLPRLRPAGRIRKGFAKDSGSNLAVDQNSANPDTTGQLARR